MCDCKSELKGQINFIRPKSLKHVEIFHTPGARLGYTLLCDCCFILDVSLAKIKTIII